MVKNLKDLVRNEVEKVIAEDRFGVIRGFKKFHPYIQISAASLFLVLGTKFDERVIYNWNLKHNSPTAIACNDYVEGDYDKLDLDAPEYITEGFNIPLSEERGF